MISFKHWLLYTRKKSALNIKLGEFQRKAELDACYGSIKFWRGKDVNFLFRIPCEHFIEA
jgi:hypothetical protein